MKIIFPTQLSFFQCFEFPDMFQGIYQEADSFVPAHLFSNTSASKACSALYQADSSVFHIVSDMQPIQSGEALKPFVTFSHSMENRPSPHSPPSQNRIKSLQNEARDSTEGKNPSRDDHNHNQASLPATSRSLSPLPPSQNATAPHGPNTFICPYCSRLFPRQCELK